MNPRFSKLVFALLLVLSVSLASLWLRAHIVQNALLQSIATARTDLTAAAEQTAVEQNHGAALSTDLIEKQNTLAQAPGALEAMRRTSALVVINRLKLAHEKNPPAPRQKQPPMGQYGFSFPELLSDPEYNQLYAQQERRWAKLSQGPKLRKLGLSAEACEKAISILTEDAMAYTDYRQITGSAGIKGDFYKQQTEATDHQLQELMGEEVFQRWKAMNETNTIFVPNAAGSGGRGYNVQSHEALVAQANSIIGAKLALRLSYSDAPLQRQQAGQLAEILANCVSTPGPGSYVYQAIFADSFIAQAGQVLSPVQVQALREFQAEQQARDKRYKLPKSSELPRNAQNAK